MPRLIAAGGLSAELEPSKVTFGEGPGVDMALPAGLGLAKVHAELRPLLGGYVIKHLGGDAFQTLVNGKPITSLANLCCGDTIQIGKIEFTLVLKDETPKETEAPVAEPAETAAVPPKTEEPEEPTIPFPRLGSSRPTVQVKAEPAPPIEPAPPVAEPPVVETSPVAELQLPAPPVSEAPFQLEAPAPPAPTVEAPPVAELQLPTPPVSETPLPVEAPAPSAPVELPPLPSNLAEAAPSPGNDELPPLPANLAESAPSPGNEEAPPAQPLIEPIETPVQPTIPSSSPKTWDDGPAAELDAGQNVTVKLAPPERPAEQARRRNPLIEFAVPSIITLLVIIGGVVFLQQHNKKLATPGEMAGPSLKASPATSAAPEPAKPPIVESKLAATLEKLQQERKRPKHHEFPAENFLFNTPGQDWLLGSMKEIPGAQVTLEHEDTGCQFAVIGEALGEDGSYTEQDLREVVKSHMVAFNPHLQFINKGKIENKGMTFNRFDARARMDGAKRYIVNISMYHQGFFYQMITFADGDGDHEAIAQRKASEMLAYFDLIDRDRTLHLTEDYKVGAYASSHYGYQVNLNEHIWEPWALREFEFPGAHMAAESAQGSIFGVMPMAFEGEVPNLDDLTTAFVGSLGIRYPAEDLKVENVVTANGQGRQVVHQRVEGRDSIQYQLQVIRREHVAYFVGGWCSSFNKVAIREIPKAIKQVSFQTPDLKAAPPNLSYGQRRAQSVIYHQLGVQKLYSEELDLALNYFKRAVDTHPAYYEVYTQLVSTYASVGRASEGLTFFKELVAKRDDVKAKAALALMHCQAGEIDEGKRQYELLFAQDFHDQTHFLGFMNALASERRYDEALELVRTVGEKESSFLQALFEASILNEKGDFEASLAVLKPLHERLSSDPMVAKEVVRALIGLKRSKEAFALADSKVIQEDPALAEYIRGVCHDHLEDYEDAKACYAKAARLDPLNREYQSALVATSSVMGQGDSSLVKVKVDAVPMPQTVKDSIKNLRADGEESVQDVYRISVVDYRKGRPYKSTEYRKVKAQDQAGVRALNTLQYGFHPTAHQIYVNYLLVRDASGEVVAEGDVNETFITDVPVTEIASDGKILHVPVPGLSPGCELEVAVTIERQGTASSFGFHREMFASEYPTGYHAFAVTGDTKPLAYHTSADIDLDKKKGVLVWSRKNIQPLKNEAYQGAIESFVPILYVNEPASETWEGLGDDYLHSLQARLDVDNATQSTARRITAKANTAREKIEALGSYVQQSITYKGIEFGQRALMPNKTSQIIENRYGDCKDHSLLLHQLLRAVGVPSHMVLIHSQLAMEERFPSMGQFNHMILAVPLDGRLEYLDCTNKFAPIIGRSVDSMAGRRCLVLEESASKLGIIPGQAVEHHISIEHDVAVAEDGSLTCEDSATFYGSSGTPYRATFASMTPAQREDALDQMLRLSRRVEIKSVEFVHFDDPSKPFTISLAYAVKDAFRQTEAGLEGSLSWPLESMLLTSDNSSDERQSPIVIRGKRGLECSVALTLPAGSSLKSWDVEKGSSQDIHAWTATREGDLSFRFTSETSPGVYPASDYPAFQASQEALLNVLETRLTIVKAGLAADLERD